jgi:diaminopimelate epimerase
MKFVKMHGAGNDFVMLDWRGGISITKEHIRAIANRPSGIGCEGVIAVVDCLRNDFAMRFFNPDGSEAELCGNGARCVAAFARRIGAVTSDVMRFSTLAGDIDAEIINDREVKISMPPLKAMRGNFINSGVPHYVVACKDIEKIDVASEGKRLRWSEEFAPGGTNVDFVEIRSSSSLRIRTYERGVEAETFACGTGAVASAAIGVARYAMHFPVEVETARKDKLIVDGSFDGAVFSGVSLTGPVEFVFEGEI